MYILFKSVSRDDLKARFYRASANQIEHIEAAQRAADEMRDIAAMMEAQAYLERLWPQNRMGKAA